MLSFPGASAALVPQFVFFLVLSGDSFDLAFEHGLDVVNANVKVQQAPNFIFIQIYWRLRHFRKGKLLYVEEKDRRLTRKKHFKILFRGPAWVKL